MYRKEKQQETTPGNFTFFGEVSRITVPLGQ
jgi:hypothetical protein